MTTVVRIHTPNGRFRLDVPAGTHVQGLPHLISSECSIPQPFKIYQDSACTEPVVRTDFPPGTILYLAFEDGDRKSATSNLMRYESGRARDTTTSFPAQYRAQTSASRATDIRAESAAGDSSGVKPAFASFDQFLTEHQYNTVSLALSQNYRGKVLARGQSNIIPSAATLKHQPYRHVDHVEFKNVAELDAFVKHWRVDLDMREQRVGWLFGYFHEDAHYPLGVRAVVEAIYEPPSSPEGGMELESLAENDDFLPTVTAVAASLGLELVGWVFTHLPREQLLTSAEVKRIARLQWNYRATSPRHYTGYSSTPLVTVTLGLAPDESESGIAKVVTNACMVSDMGVAFERDGILDEQQLNPMLMHLRQPLKGEILPDILESGKSVQTFDPDWLVVRVNDSAPKEIRSFFRTWSFPVENRSNRIQRPSDIAMHLRSSPGRSGQVTNEWTAFADWHLLLYIARLFDPATACAVCSHVRQRRSLDQALADTFSLL